MPPGNSLSAPQERSWWGSPIPAEQRHQWTQWSKTVTALIWDFGRDVCDTEPFEWLWTAELDRTLGKRGRKEGPVAGKIQHVVSCGCNSSCSQLCWSCQEMCQAQLKWEGIGDCQKEYWSKTDYLTSVCLGVKLPACWELLDLKMH